MGFLLGAFGKLAAGRRVRSLQAQMMRIQSRARRATRDVANMEKSLQRQEQYALNALKTNGQAALMQAKSVFQSPELIALQNKAMGGTELSAKERDQLNSLTSKYTNGTTQVSAIYEQRIAQSQQEIQDYFEYLREAQLEPLKNEEEMLQTEKDSLESQIQIAQADYEACKKMEQADAKNLAPNYTGQG